MVEPIMGHRSRWKILPINERFLAHVSISPMLAHLLYNRGYKDSFAITAFLNHPIYEHDPYQIPDMDRAVSRIQDAIAYHEKIGIYADFDCDGLTAAAVMYQTLQDLGADLEVVIPQRKEGHGLASFRLKELRAKGVTLIVTVDCGVTAIGEVKEAKTLGMDTIITDHHEPLISGELPACLVVNPNRHDSTYPFRGLSGVGVAYKVASALSGEERSDLLDYVALGTIADVVPIRDENRGFVLRGLRRIQYEGRVGLTSLLYACDIQVEKMDAATVAFSLAPRINAANRLADPRDAYEMLVTDSYDDAGKIAAHLGNLNERRKELLDRYMQTVFSEVGSPAIVQEQAQEDKRAPIIIVKGQWEPGLSGLIASRIVDTYGFPAIVAAEDDGWGRIAASARSIPGTSIISILESAHERMGDQGFHKHGGHSGAAGFILHKDRWDYAVQQIEAASRSTVDRNTSGSILTVDAEIPFTRVTNYSVAQINKLAPFGQSFSEPLFLSRCVKISKQKRIGSDGKHLSFKVYSGNHSIRGVMFSHDPELENISEDVQLDIVYHMQRNTFHGYTATEIQLKDWRFSEKCDTLGDEERDMV